jgi:3-dehydro-L-gulonate 2-dehydrogenase
MHNSSKVETLRIPTQQLNAEFYRILLKHKFPSDKAKACAEIFTSNAVDGIYSHSVNRFAKFIQYVDEGHVNPGAEAICKSTTGSVEQWDGQSGVGVLNAMVCTERAMTLASEFGMGCVALANTNHWMRAGAYGRKAAADGFAFIGWTNTNSNTPAWGAVDARLGNNPLIMAVPYGGDAIVLDMAMSQYSYGALDLYKLKGERLPVAGGFDESGKLSDDPEAILKTRRTLPIGYWKGAGLSLLLDILATTLSGGLSVSEISKQQAETNVSQVFIAFNLSGLAHHNRVAGLIRQIIDDYHGAASEKGDPVRYPGERILQTRAENSSKGIPVLKKVWEEILSL